MRCTRIALIGAALATIALSAAEPALTEYRLPRVSWAWGTIGLRNVDGSLGKLAKYFDRIATNSGALARLSLTTWLLPIPMEDGLKKDGPALILLLDPGLVGGTRDEKALILTVENAATLKESLEAVFGTTMKEGVLQVTVPRGFNEPDATLLLKITPAGLLVAPNAKIMKDLETLAGGKGAAQFIDPNGTDALAEIDLEVLRRIEQRTLDGALGSALKAASVAAPSIAGQVDENVQRLQKFLRDLERLQFRISVDPQELRLTARLCALADTELALRWQPQPEPPAGTWNVWCQPETALFVAGRFPAVWACPEKDLSAWLAKYLPTDSAAGRTAQESVARTLAAWLGQLNGDVALAVRVNKDGAWFPLTLFGSKSDGQPDTFDQWIAPFATLLAERLRTDFKLPADAPIPAVIEKTGEGLVRRTVRFQDAKLEAWAKERFEALSGWPLEFSTRRVNEGWVLGWGKGADACVSAEFTARADEKDPFDKRPDGTAGCALVHPATVMRVYLRQAKALSEASTEQVLQGLSNTPLCVYWGQGDGAIQLELRAAADSLRTGTEGYLRMLRVGYDPGSAPAQLKIQPAPKENAEPVQEKKSN